MVSQAAVRRAAAAACAVGTYVAAAGNDGANACHTSPAAVPSAVAVGTTVEAPVTVSDTWVNDTGTLNSWSLRFWPAGRRLRTY